MKYAANLINGKETKAAETIEVHNPAHYDEVVGVIPRSSASEVADAVGAAQDARQLWRSAGAMARGNALFAASRIIEEHIDELATLASREMGKPIGESRGEVLRAVAILRYYAGEGARSVGDVIPAANPKTLQYTTRDPVGVVAVITPWNFPLAIPMWKVAPALAYGNTVVVKPAELASLTAYRMFSLILSCFPNGVLNVVIGEGREAGEALVQDPRVDAITFTGSGIVGRHIAEVATAHGVKYQLEMGGKNPVIVADDADLGAAVELTVSGAMRSAGQKCTATSRLIVTRSVHGTFRDALVKRVQQLKVGDPLDADTYLGPLVSAPQKERVMSFIEEAQRSDSALLVGGNPLDLSGHFVPPTIFDEVSGDAPIAQEEVFGPVVAIVPVTSLDEAIDVANSVRYGLSASVFTKNLATALEVVDRLDAGMVRVNEETAGVEYQAPFGGKKESSSHSREQGRAAIEFFTETKTVAIRGV